MLKIGIALPAYGHNVDVAHVPTWLRLGVAFASQAEHFDFSGIGVTDQCNLSRARNELVMHSLKNGDDWMLTVDADTTVKNPEKLLDMIAEGEKQHAAIIAAPVRHRASDGWNVQTDNFKAMPVETFMDKVVPVQSIGAACMAVNVRWLRDNWPSPPWFQFEHIGDNQWMGEDLRFCVEAQKRGGTVLCDGRVHCMHRVSGGYV
jgi:hypothetical protein